MDGRRSLEPPPPGYCTLYGPEEDRRFFDDVFAWVPGLRLELPFELLLDLPNQNIFQDLNFAPHLPWIASSALPPY